MEAMRNALFCVSLHDEVESLCVPNAELRRIFVRVVQECHQVTIVLCLGVVSGHELNLATHLFAFVFNVLDDSALLKIILVEAVLLEAVNRLLAEFIVRDSRGVNVAIFLAHKVWIYHQPITAKLWN